MWKTILKEIKETFKEWRYVPCSQIGRPNIVKKSLIFPLTYRVT